MRLHQADIDIYVLGGTAPSYYDYYDYSGGPEGCPGCSQPTEVNQEIVDFAVSQFSGINKNCFNIEVENFQSQVCRI